MSAKPFPDLSAYTSPRGKLYKLREFLLDNDATISLEDARRLMATTLGLAIDLVGQTHSPSKFDLDRNEAERLLRGEIAMYVRPST